MLPRIEPEERMQSSDRAVLIVVSVFVFGAFAAELLTNFSRLKLGALVLLVAYVGLIGVHEAGHAVAASLLGWRVCRIVIGMGKPLLRFRVWDVPVIVCRYPVGGHVVPAPRTLRGARYKSSLIYLAGPGIELLLVAVLVAVFGYEALAGPAKDLSLLVAQATAAAALFGAVLNLIPLRTEGAMTDGLGFLSSPTLPEEVLDSWRALPYTTRAEAHLLSDKREHAVSVLETGVEKLAESFPCRLRLAAFLLEANAAERVVDLLDPLVAREDVPKALQPAILSLLAEALLVCRPSRLDDASDYTEYALGLVPHDAETALARARVLIEQSKYHEAERLLAQVRPRVGDEQLTDTRDTMVALLELRRGQRPAALGLFAEIDARGARGVELDQLKSELGVESAPCRKPAVGS